MSTAALEPTETDRLDRVLGAYEAGEGPTLVVVGGVHGNEPAGLLAAKHVLERLRSERPERFRGRLVVLRGNLGALSADAPSLVKKPRYVQADLNRLFVDDLVSVVRMVDHAELAAERRELRELVDVLTVLSRESTRGMHVIDLHTVSSDSPAFIAVEDSLLARGFAQRFGVPLLLGIEEELRGLLMNYVTNHLGRVAMVLEAGRHDDPGVVGVHEAAIWTALDGAGVLPLDGVTHANSPESVLRRASGARSGHVYDVRCRRAIEDASYATRAEARVFMPVRAGRTPVADERGQAVSPHVTGLLFMPNRQASPHVGDDAFFVVRRVGMLWLGLSAWFRRAEWVHALLPRMLPGVRRGERPGELIIAADIATIATREVFHLLGYRIVQRPDERHLHLMGRLRLAARAGILAIRRLIRGRPRAGAPEQRSTDWVVRRHVLDRAPVDASTGRVS